MKHVKIYGTLGPACANEYTLTEMLREGMDGIRLNLSHTTLDAAADWIGAYRRAAKAVGVSPDLLIDLQGPELRIGALESPITLFDGKRIEKDAIPFPKCMLPALCAGREILLDDGKILLRAESDALTVVRGGILESRKSAAIDGVSFDVPALTDMDREHIRRAADFGVTAVMQPFVRSRQDLIDVRSALPDGIRLLAKVENRQGLDALDELLPYCDEIVIARGDLGNAVPLWELPAVQKRIAKTCNAANRDFMVVTQMLDSMTHRPVPTRAEVSDIFNAVLDGASSVMVTGETATGAYPALAIRYLKRTVEQAEAFRSL